MRMLKQLLILLLSLGLSPAIFAFPSLIPIPKEVTGVFHVEENIAIPPDGLLLSVNVTGSDKHNNLRRLLSHEKIRILAAYPEAGSGNTLSGTLAQDTQQLILIFAAKLWPFSEIPAEAVSIHVKKQGGGDAETLAIQNDFALTPDPHFTGNFQKYCLKDGLLAVGWNRKPEEQPEQLELVFSDMGLAMGMRLVGAFIVK